MISDKMQTLIGEALKANDQTRLSTLRMLETAFNYERIAKQHALTSDEEVDVIKREAKKRRDAIEAYAKVTGDAASRAKEKSDAEKKELKVLEEYLPKQLSDVELEKLVEDAIADLPADATPQALQAGMGKVIGMVMGKAKGSVDGGRVSQMVRQKLVIRNYLHD